MERMSITTTQAALDKLLGGMTRYGSEVWESADGRLMIAKGFDGWVGIASPDDGGGKIELAYNIAEG